jgi:hypothetical protein
MICKYITVSLECKYHSVNRPSGHTAFTSSTTHRCKGVATHAHSHYRNRRIPASTTGHPHARRRIVHSCPHTKASLEAAYTDTHTAIITRRTELAESTTCHFNCRRVKTQCDLKARQFYTTAKTYQNVANIFFSFFLNNQPDALIIQIYSFMKLYMFRASKPAWNLPVPNVQR